MHVLLGVTRETGLEQPMLIRCPACTRNSLNKNLCFTSGKEIKNSDQKIRIDGVKKMGPYVFRNCVSSSFLFYKDRTQILSHN